MPRWESTPPAARVSARSAPPRRTTSGHATCRMCWRGPAPRAARSCRRDAMLSLLRGYSRVRRRGRRDHGASNTGGMHAATRPRGAGGRASRTTCGVRINDKPTSSSLLAACHRRLIAGARSRAVRGPGAGDGRGCCRSMFQLSSARWGRLHAQDRRPEHAVEERSHRGGRQQATRSSDRPGGWRRRRVDKASINPTPWGRRCGCCLPNWAPAFRARGRTDEAARAHKNGRSHSGWAPLVRPQSSRLGVAGAGGRSQRPMLLSSRLHTASNDSHRDTTPHPLPTKNRRLQPRSWALSNVRTA